MVRKNWHVRHGQQQVHAVGEGGRGQREKLSAEEGDSDVQSEASVLHLQTWPEPEAEHPATHGLLALGRCLRQVHQHHVRRLLRHLPPSKQKKRKRKRQIRFV